MNLSQLEILERHIFVMDPNDTFFNKETLIRSIVIAGVVIVAIAMLAQDARSSRLSQYTQPLVGTVLITPQLYATPAGPKDDAQNKKHALLAITEEDSDLFSQGQCSTGSRSGNEEKFFMPVNKEGAIGESIPARLVEVQDIIPTKGNRAVCLDETTAIHLKEMITAAKEEGHILFVTSGYRSFSTQFRLFTEAVTQAGFEGTRRVAPPGHSEHQLGTAIDLTSQSVQGASAAGNFGSSPEGKWVLNNGYRFGFIQSYENGKEDVTGYMPESWHHRFIGIENATKIHDSALTLHEVLTSKDFAILPQPSDIPLPEIAG